MEENKNLTEASPAVDTSNKEDIPHDKNLKLMSPTQMVLRRFFRSKLSVVGLVMVISLFIFSFLGPIFYNEWEQNEPDKSGLTVYTVNKIEYTDSEGNRYEMYGTVEKGNEDNSYASPSGDHLLGTDRNGYDIFVRLMYGGRVSLIVSFLTVFVITILGVIFGGVAGYFGGKVDNVIMRISDILMCLPGIPLLMIIYQILFAAGAPEDSRIYILMFSLSLVSWTGTARLVRGQILFLREQEYMIAAEAMGYSSARKIFKHLIPNVMPQLIVQMTLSLGSMILYESSLSYLGMGVPDSQAAWGSMISIITQDPTVNHNLFEYFHVWGPAGLSIVIAVLGFNFVGDGLRDALDPKMRR